MFLIFPTLSLCEILILISIHTFAHLSPYDGRNTVLIIDYCTYHSFKKSHMYHRFFNDYMLNKLHIMKLENVLMVFRNIRHNFVERCIVMFSNICDLNIFPIVCSYSNSIGLMFYLKLDIIVFIFGYMVIICKYSNVLE